GFPGMFAVGERFFQLRVVERLAEPGGLPKEKWHQHEQKRQRQDGKQPAALEAWFGGRGDGIVGQAIFLALRGRNKTKEVPRFAQNAKHGGTHKSRNSLPYLE